MMLRYKDLKAAGVSHTQAYLVQLVAAGKFPKPFKAINGFVCWQPEEIAAWVAEKIAAIEAGGRARPLLPTCPKE